MIVVSNYILLNCPHLLRSYPQTCKLKIDQGTIAVTISSQLCSRTSFFCKFEYLFLLVSPFLRKTRMLQASLSKNIVPRNACVPLATTVTRKRIQASSGNEVCWTSAPFSNLLAIRGLNCYTPPRIPKLEYRYSVSLSIQTG